MRFQVSTKKANTLTHITNDGFFFIHIEKEMVTKKFGDGLDYAMKPIQICRHHIKVIHISSIVPTMQLAFDILVQFIQIDIAEQLTCQVAYG